MIKHERLLRVAIVGSGPAAFFCADYLLRLSQPCEVCMIEQRPTPFGLVRDAVAPDRMNIRSVSQSFERIAEHAGFSWFGNVRVGRDVTVSEMQRYFDAVIIATGASTPRRLDIQGEELSQYYSASAFAGWYNGSLDHAALHPDLSQPAAVIIGAGNAALDVARLLTTPPESLAASDISSTALRVLRESNISDVHVVARRGPLEARFHPDELHHLAAIPECRVVMHTSLNDSNAELSPGCQQLLEAYQRLVQTQQDKIMAKRRIHLHFNLTPFAILGDDAVEGVLFLDASETPVHIACGLAIAGIGHYGVGVESVPYDPERGVVPNSQGRVLDAATTMPGIYTAGWVKRGAHGVIGANKPCCRETVQSIMDDRDQLLSETREDSAGFVTLLKERGIRYLTYRDWQQIDAAEKQQGIQQQKARERFHSTETMLSLLTTKSAGQ